MIADDKIVYLLAAKSHSLGSCLILCRMLFMPGMPFNMPGVTVELGESEYFLFLLG